MDSLLYSLVTGRRRGETPPRLLSEPWGWTRVVGSNRALTPLRPGRSPRDATTTRSRPGRLRRVATWRELELGPGERSRSHGAAGDTREQERDPHTLCPAGHHLLHLWWAAKLRRRHVQTSTEAPPLLHQPSDGRTPPRARFRGVPSEADQMPWTAW